jgi:hypothetical protein
MALPRWPPSWAARDGTKGRRALRLYTRQGGSEVGAQRDPSRSSSPTEVGSRRSGGGSAVWAKCFYYRLLETTENVNARHLDYLQQMVSKWETHCPIWVAYRERCVAQNKAPPIVETHPHLLSSAPHQRPLSLLCASRRTAQSRR